MKILIIGGTGTIGLQIMGDWMQEGYEKKIDHEIINLSRHYTSFGGVGVATFYHQIWDGQKFPDLDFVPEYIINLAGAGIADESWTPARRKLILDSRIKSTRACVEYIREHKDEVKLFVNGSAVGYYGADREDICTEESAPGNDFLAEVCQAWEQEAMRAPIRTVLLRTGIVMSRDGGALQKLLPIFRAGMGGWLGSGKQSFPWIDVREFSKIIEWLIKNEDISGPVNVCTPVTISNFHFSKTLAKVLKRPCLFPVPQAGIKLILGARAELLLKGQNAYPEKLIKSGYLFEYDNLVESLEYHSKIK